MDMPRKVIITGDDFGLAMPVNDAILEAHRKGILTTASLMIGAKFAQDAVNRARQCPSLKVGLHLVLVEGRSVLPSKKIPDLVDESGMFWNHLARAGFRFFFYPGIKRQLEAEIRAQFEAFRDTGLPLDHVNAHNHMHIHPTVLRLLLRVGREYDLKAVRFPFEPPVQSSKAVGEGLGSRLATSIFLYPWLNLMKRLLHRAGIRHNNYFFGMTDSGAMTLARTLAFLRHLPKGTSELCFHPATRRCWEIDQTMPNYRHEEELSVLMDMRLQKAILALDIRMIAFSDLSKGVNSKLSS
jgi:hopanoid biosynthesis associated protein HpnK